MNGLSELKEALTAFLQEQLDGVSVAAEYPARWRQAPPVRPCVAVGLAGATLSGAPGGSGQAKVTLRFDILCPAHAHGGCHAVFEALCDALVRGRAAFGVGEISCGELTCDRGLPALLLTAQATFSGLLAPDGAQGGEPLEAVVVKAKGVTEL